GGTSTDSAKFAVLNVDNGTPVASVSSGVDGTAAYLSADGTLQTQNMQTLTLGGSTTGNVTINAGSGLISLLDSTDISGALTLSGTISDSDGNLVLDDQTDIGSATTGIRIATSGSISDIDGN